MILLPINELDINGQNVDDEDAKSDYTADDNNEDTTTEDNADDNTDDTTCYDIDKYVKEDLLNILKEN